MHSLSARHELQISAVPRGVVVHVFFAGLHELAPQAVSLSAAHCTHVPVPAPASASLLEAAVVLQTPFPAMFVQSAFVVQGVQSPAMHADADADLQSDCVRHSTQRFFEVSQSRAFPQSPFFVHWTQVFFEVSQTGVAPEQSESFVHCTHCSVLGLHTGFGAEQLLSVVHCTQVFFEVSQTGVAAMLEQWVFCVHGTQTFFEVSHAGFGAEQLLSAVHSTHFWLAVLQAGFGPEHWVPVRHSTHVFVLSSQTGVVPLHAGVHAEVVPPVPSPPVDVPALVPPALVPPRLEPPTLEPPAPLEFVSLVLFPPELAPPERVLLSPELVPPTPPSLRSTSAQERLEAQSELRLEHAALVTATASRSKRLGRWGFGRCFIGMCKRSD